MATLELDALRLIKNATANIDNNIHICCPEHISLCAQNILAQMRNVVDAFALFLYYKMDQQKRKNNGYEAIKAANKVFKDYCNKNGYEKIADLHNQLQASSSHYTQSEYGSELLIQKYLPSIYLLKKAIKKECGIDVLENINGFPYCKERESLRFYETVFNCCNKNIPPDTETYIYYIEKKKCIIINDDSMLFEYVIAPANDEVSKFNRMTVYSKEDIVDRHAISLDFYRKNVIYNGIEITVHIIKTYLISIRPVELRKFYQALTGKVKNINRDSVGYKTLMGYLTSNNCTLYDLIFSNNFDEAMLSIFGNRDVILSTLLKTTKELLKDSKPFFGQKTLIYLLYTMRNNIIKDQLADGFPSFENCGLSLKCTPFEKHPFVCNLVNHIPAIGDLVSCLHQYCSAADLFYREVLYKIEVERNLFPNVADLEKNFLVKKEAEIFNSSLDDYFHRNKLLFTNNGKNIYIKKYAVDTKDILNILLQKSTQCDHEFETLAKAYLSSIDHNLIDDTKISILTSGFSVSSVLLIKGSAGTGKTTIIGHFAKILSDKKILFLTQTHSALNNLKRRICSVVSSNQHTFCTIRKFLSSNYLHLNSYDLLVVDESTTVPNEDMLAVLNNVDTDKIILVGDDKQIGAIKFGNWFSLAANILDCSYELQQTHRTNDKNLLMIWDQVRKNKPLLLESLTSAGFVKKIDNSIFEKNVSTEDEIILCLNYDGLYGINYVNKHMQNMNRNTPYSWKVWTFKKDDKILFNDNYYFNDYFYNNQKGIIDEITDEKDKIIFVVKVRKENDERTLNFTCPYLKYLKTIEDYNYFKIIISKKYDDEDKSLNNGAPVVPFQLAYAISIHKSQGLEYESVKVICSREMCESISLNIFYTAITRCKRYLAICGEDPLLGSIINNFQIPDFYKDEKILISMYPELAEDKPK